MKVLYVQMAMNMMNKKMQLKENNHISYNVLHQCFIVAYLLKSRGMVCVYVTHLRLTNYRFCVICLRMNHFKAHLMG